MKNGSPINPLTMKMPPAVPVPKGKMDDFNEAKEDARRAVIHFTAMEFFNKSVKVLVEE